MSSRLHQASCVAIEGRGLLIEGPPGSGKSSLALALIDRGAVLVGDDGVILDERDEQVWALPAPNIRGLLEIRNVGLFRLPVAEARVALVVTLDLQAARLPERPVVARRAGRDLPALALYPDSPVLPLRAERALEMHGLA